jgi:hypothetical protein
MTLEILERPKNRTVEASLLFVEPSKTKPEVMFGYEGGVAETNALYVPRKVVLNDARRILPYLDADGFALLRHRSAVHDFWDDAEAENAGRAEAAELVANATGARRVHVFDHTQRRRAPDARRQPSTRVHVDYTLKSAPQRVRDLFGEEADALLAKPFAFINVWRPISHRAEDWPLALADARTVAPGELVATDIVYPDRRGEIYNLTHSPRHRWWYVPDMGLDEALLIKCYDSRPHIARFTPHTAFESPATRANAPPRESIEFRTIASFD